MNEEPRAELSARRWRREAARLLPGVAASRRELGLPFALALILAVAILAAAAGVVLSVVLGDLDRMRELEEASRTIPK